MCEKKTTPAWEEIPAAKNGPPFAAVPIGLAPQRSMVLVYGAMGLPQLSPEDVPTTEYQRLAPYAFVCCPRCGQVFEDRRLLPIHQVAINLGASLETVRWWIKKGLLRSRIWFKSGRTWKRVIESAEVNKFMNEHFPYPEDLTGWQKELWEQYKARSKRAGTASQAARRAKRQAQQTANQAQNSSNPAQDPGSK